MIAIVFLVTIMSSFAQQPVVGYEYWYNDDHSAALFVPTATQEALNVNTTFPTTGLNAGFHMLHFRAKDDTDRYSSVKSQFFLKLPETGNAEREIVAYEYWFNDDYANAVAAAVTPGQAITLNTNLLTNTVSNGIHLLRVRFKDNSGQWSSVVSRHFLKTPETVGASSEMVTYRYWIGSDLSNAVYGQFMPPDAVVQLTDELDMTALTEGEHVIHFQHRDDAGRWSTVMTDTFERAQITVDVIENDLSNSLQVYPNPTTGELTLTFDEQYETVDLRLLDTQGRLLQSERYTRLTGIRFSVDQPKGTYLLEVTSDENEQSIIRIIKN